MEDKLLRQLKRIRDELDGVITEAEAGSNGVPDTAYHKWFRRAGGVLNHVSQAGGEVKPDVWRTIGEHYGYDPRGMAGFYSGRDPSMRRDPDTDVRILTERGKLEAQNWRRLFAK